MFIHLQYATAASYTHSHTPAVTPASATDHFPPSTACSSLSAYGSQSEAEKPLSSASLYTCIIEHQKKIKKYQFTNKITYSLTLTSYPRPRKSKS